MKNDIDKGNLNLVIASSNPDKVKEFKDLLFEFPFHVYSQPEGLDINEIGQSFSENARIKALAVSEITGECSLADDSGLCVDALNGAPGIYSARYASTDIERIKKLLTNLNNFNNRDAHFTSALCIAFQGKVLIEVEGICSGLIAFQPRGQEGFGYDPIFEVKELALTFAEMGMKQKKMFGHRGIAFKLLKPRLKEILKLNLIK